MNKILCKRIYEPADASDGYRILVDRLWPRGIKKDAAAIDLWDRNVAPTNDLRKWFSHIPERYEEFTVRYRQELDVSSEARSFTDLCTGKLQEGNVTLLYAAKDQEHNHAIVLRQWLEEIYNSL